MVDKETLIKFEDSIVEIYNKGNTLLSIRNKFKIGQIKLYKILKKYNLKLRGRGNNTIPWNLHKNLTEEHKLKIRLKCKNINKGKNNPMFGVSLIPWNKNMRYSWSKEARIKNKNSSNYFKKGDLHPNWKGGISSINNLIRECETYNRWRKEIYKRDNYKCVSCASNIKIEAHHKFPLYKIIKLNNIKTLEEAYLCKDIWNLENGETKCLKCHNLTKGGIFKS